MDANTRLRRLATYTSGLFEESDRAAVVVGAATVDELLGDLLKKVLRPPQGDDRLFGPDAPLGSFSSRIEMASRLGLIDEPITAGLQLVRKIRNAMAHKILAHSLSLGAEQDRTRELFRVVCERVKASPALWDRIVPARVPRIRSTPGKQFRLALSFLIVALEEGVETASPIHATAPLCSIPERKARYRMRARGANKAPNARRGNQ